MVTRRPKANFVVSVKEPRAFVETEEMKRRVDDGLVEEWRSTESSAIMGNSGAVMFMVYGR